MENRCFDALLMQRYVSSRDQSRGTTYFVPEYCGTLVSFFSGRLQGVVSPKPLRDQWHGREESMNLIFFHRKYHRGQ